MNDEIQDCPACSGHGPCLTCGGPDHSWPRVVLDMFLLILLLYATVKIWPHLTGA